MVKQGPCYHCGVTNTPLWRNGPSEKPVLCNACGSRWRTKGSLANYTPLHARGELLDSECAKIPRPIFLPIKKDLELHKRTYDVIVEVEGEASNADQNFQKLEEDSSNRSSSGSAVSYSESCAHFGAAEANEMTVGAQSTVWNSLVPSRKRTCIGRPKQSPVEKLTKELQSILDEQHHLSLVSASSEEDLLLESGTLMDSFEMGHGGCLLKYSNLESGAQESEASSFSVDNKYQSASDAYSAVSSLSASDRNEMTGLLSIENERAKKLTVLASQENIKRDKISPDELMAMVNDTSLLTTVDLRDVVNHEVFMSHLTSEEQELLMKDLPSLQGGKPPDSLKEIFVSPQFLETVSSFQQLLLEGVSSSSSSRMSNEEFRSFEVHHQMLHSPKQSCWTTMDGNAKLRLNVQEAENANCFCQNVRETHSDCSQSMTSNLKNMTSQN